MNDEQQWALERAATRFLYAEAEMLDAGRLQDWLKSLHPEIDYRIPVRQNVEREHGKGFSSRAFFMEEDFSSLKMRIARLDSDFAWAENPRTRTRRIVSNIRVTGHCAENGRTILQVASSTATFCHRGDNPEPITVTYERQDTLAREGGGWCLLERVVLLDSTVLGLESLSIFL